MYHVAKPGITNIEELDQTVYRCGYCRAVILPLQIATKGCCPECGSRFMRKAATLTDDEVAKAKADGYVFTSDRWVDGPFQGFAEDDATVGTTIL